MATITTNTFLDDGTARTAGEAWTMNNGAVLTVRTDTRWHANAPASMTGSFAGITGTNGGLFIEGRNVRWLAYDTGSGNVPAIGTSVTQGGVSGYLLAVYSSLTSAPTAVGASMPASGFIKFREVTGGVYSAGALTGIGASATGADVPGWIEVAMEGNTSMSYLGPGVTVRGSWFQLGTTNGSIGQTFQVPTNGGGSGTSVAAIQIETAPGSGVYEWYPSLVANSTTGGFITAALNTDARAKYVHYAGGGLVRIGSDGTNNIGFVPPSGCKVRVPNVFIRQTSSGSRASNTLPNTTITSRSSLLNGAGKYDIENADINLYLNSSGLNLLRLVNTCAEARINIGIIRGSLELNSICLGHCVVANQQGIVFTGLVAGNDNTIINDIHAPFITAGQQISFTTCKNLTLTNVKAAMVFNRAAANNIINVTSGSSNITFDGLKCWGGRIVFSSSSVLKFKNVDYIDRMSGATTSTVGQYIFNGQTASSSDIEIDGVTFGNGGTLSDCHPYDGILIASQNKNVKMRNIGTRSAPLPTGSNASLYPNVIYNTAADESDVEIKRVYLENTRSAPLSISGVTNMLVENVYSANTAAINPQGSNIQLKGIYGNNSTSTGTRFSVFYVDRFSSNTAGNVTLYFAAPLEGDPNIEFNFTGASGFTDVGRIDFSNGAGSYVIYEMSYFALGHTGFANSAPTVVATDANFQTLEYQINTGAGYNGTWKTLNGTNLSSETISPSVGFKLKIRVTAVNVGNYSITSVQIATTSTLTAQTDNLYPLSVATLSFTGLQPGSEVRAYLGTDPATSVEIAGVESTAGSTFSFTHDKGGTAGYIMVFALGYQPIRIPYTYKTTDDSLLIQQVVDRNYSNPV